MHAKVADLVVVRAKDETRATLAAWNERPWPVLRTWVFWSVVVALGLLVGVPLGIALGRGAWTLMAEDLGVVSSPEVPALALGILVVAALLLANLIALWPARVAASTPAATVLRSE